MPYFRRQLFYIKNSLLEHWGFAFFIKVFYHNIYHQQWPYENWVTKFIPLKIILHCPGIEFEATKLLVLGCLWITLNSGIHPKNGVYYKLNKLKNKFNTWRFNFNFATNSSSTSKDFNQSNVNRWEKLMFLDTQIKSIKIYIKIWMYCDSN